MQFIVKKTLQFTLSTLLRQYKQINKEILRNIFVRLKIKFGKDFIFVSNKQNIFVRIFIKIQIFTLRIFLIFRIILKFLIIVFVINFLQ